LSNKVLTHLASVLFLHQEVKRYQSIIGHKYLGAVWIQGSKEVRKWGSVISHFLIFQTLKKKNEKIPFSFLFSLLHNYYLTTRVLQLILWWC